MFALPVAAPYREILYAAMILWAALLILGLAFGPFDPVRMRRIPLINRMASSFILVVGAVIWWLAGARTTPLAGYAALVAAGMACGFLGDLLMAQVIPTPNRVVFGMAAFGAGHIVYVMAYRALGIALQIADSRVYLVSLATVLALGGATWRSFVRSPQAPKALNYGSLGYSLLLAVMGGMAFALAAQEPGLIILAAGAGLFFISDTLLGNEVVRENRWRPVGDVVWMTYILGQALIVFSTAAALRLLAR